jgi:hypothetical protein
MRGNIVRALLLVTASAALLATPEEASATQACYFFPTGYCPGNVEQYCMQQGCPWPGGWCGYYQIQPPPSPPEYGVFCDNDMR